MAYEVTATRRRPQRFEDLAGQEFVAETLKNSIITKKIAHAYLFSGPRGCGKTSTARILAKALNCQSSDGPNAQPCGQCESCKAITNSSSLDVIEIDGASNTSVNDVRQIKDEVMFPPNTSRYKIYIIDEVHMLSTSAFNALLKTIEEPPPYVIFIFATTELQKVPATIKSRCQQFNFRLVAAEKVKTLLAEACAELQIQADAEALYWIAKESGGSIRDSYTLFDQVAAFSDGYITYEKISDKLGILSIEKLNNLFESCCDENCQEATNILDELLQSGLSIEQIISNSTEYLRSLLLLKNGIKKESLLGQSSERYSQKVLSSWNKMQIERALSIFFQLYKDIRYTINPRYELELAFSRLCWLKEYVSNVEVKHAIDQAKDLLLTSNVDLVNSGNSVKNDFKENQANYENQNLKNQNVQNVQEKSFVNQNVQNNFGQNTGVQNSSEKTDFSNNLSNANENYKNVPKFAIFSENQNLKSQNQEESENNPFQNSGAMPQTKIMAAKTQNDENNVNFGNNIQNSLNSDEEWLDTEVPEDDYQNDFDEENSENSTESFNLNSKNNSFQQNNEKTDFNQNIQDYDEENSSDLANSNQENHQIFVAKDGFSTELGKIYGATVAELSVNNAMLASSLMQTGKWTLEGNKIKTSIKTEYQKKFIEENLQNIIPVISKYAHEQMQFEIQLLEEKAKNEPKELPLQVKILCNAFKGSVVGVN